MRRKTYRFVAVAKVTYEESDFIPEEGGDIDGVEAEDAYECIMDMRAKDFNWVLVEEEDVDE